MTTSSLEGSIVTRNFVITYTGHEGSSAIVSMLGTHPQVWIPVFEHFDLPNFSAHFDRNRVADVIEYMFRTGVYPRAIGDVECRDRSKRPASSVGFKWRPFKAPGVIDALIANDAVVFMLFRRNALRRSLSMFFSHVYLNRRHLQFEISKLEESVRRERIDELRSEHFLADPDSVLDLIVSATRSKAAQRELICTPFLDAGGTVQPIFYEDLVGDALGFVNSMFSAIGCRELESTPESRYTKVNRDQIEDQVTNIGDILADESIAMALQKYDALVSAIMLETSYGRSGSIQP